MQLPELSVLQAIEESPRSSDRLAALAAVHRADHSAVGVPDTRKHWESEARTFCYQTHIAIEGQDAGRLDWLAAVLFDAATLPSQPWYPQFLGGASEPLDLPPPAGVHEHQLTLGRFSLGLRAPRVYRQLLSLAKPDERTRVIVARSVDAGPALEPGVRLAYTLAPNGEVLCLEDDVLHWHHICCTPGIGMLPGPLDRWLINTLRRTGLDRAERRTYREEAERMRDWLALDDPALPV